VGDVVPEEAAPPHPVCVLIEERDQRTAVLATLPLTLRRRRLTRQERRRAALRL